MCDEFARNKHETDLEFMQRFFCLYSWQNIQSNVDGELDYYQTLFIKIFYVVILQLPFISFYLKHQFMEHVCALSFYVKPFYCIKNFSNFNCTNHKKCLTNMAIFIYMQSQQDFNSQNHILKKNIAERIILNLRYASHDLIGKI